jgi:predicted alpha/beta superfamily hydrolase
MRIKTCGGMFGAALFIFGAGCATKPEQQPAPVAPPPDTAIKIGEKFSLQSKILKERRNYWVYLPESYHNKTFAPKRYPVLYILDGDAHFHTASGLARYMSINGNFQMPEVIVVAILNTQRTRDLTPSHSLKTTKGKDEPTLASSGGGEKFLDFIRDELIPEIEGKYRTAPYRILVGHSFGGLFAMNALFRRPEIFQAYISIDPSLWWDDQLLLRRAKSMLEKTNDFRGSVYVTLANNHPSTEDWDAELADKAVRDLAETLKTNSSDAFRIALQYYDSEEHVSVALISLYHGLRFIFDGYKAPPAVIDNPSLAEGHFAKMSERMGYKVLPPEEFASTWGEGALYWYRATNKAIQWFSLNIKNYPDSFINYDSLGYVYAQSGDKEPAIKNYQKALELNPGHRRATEQIRRLKGFSDTGPFTNGVYKLINKKSGKALEVGGGSETNSANVVQARYAGRLHQQWNFTAQGDGYYQITAAHSRKALAIANDNATAPGARLLQRPVHGRANQIWRVVANGDGTYRLLNEHSSLAIRAAGSIVDQWPWEDSAQQKWRIYPAAY